MMIMGVNDNSRMIATMALAVGLFLLSLSSACSGSLPSGRLVVLGVHNDVGRPEWDDQLIGHGLAQLLLQQLYDTGLYTPIEDNPEILQEITRIIGANWSGEAKPYTSDQIDGLAKRFGSDVTAYAIIKKVATERNRTVLGPFSSAKTEVLIEVEVVVKKIGEPEVRAFGEGRSATKSKSMMFKVRNNKLQLDETAVGKSVDKAIKKAVEGLNQ